MARLKALAPQLGSLAPIIARHSDAEGHSQALEPWRPWYATSRWRQLRLEIFERDLFTCQMPGCGTLVSLDVASPLPLATCDHRIPHHGDEALFWDRANLQTLCKPCHDKVKQRLERRAGPAGLGAPGGQGQARGQGPGQGGMAHPAWFRRSHVPLVAVCGPPGAGKSTYVRQQAGPDDRIICFDELATALFGRDGEQRARTRLDVNGIAGVLRARNEALGDLMRAQAKARWPAAWLILTEPKAEHRTWWAERLGARVVVLATPAQVCKARIAADELAGDHRGLEALAQVDVWWRTYRPAPCDETL